MNGPHRDSWTILEILRWTTDYFQKNGVSEPRASAEVLLAHALGLSRLDLYLRHDQPLTAAELARFKALMLRRRQGEPVAYLTGHKEFWSLDLVVTPAVLIPRPETELLVQAALEAAHEFFPPQIANRKPETGPSWGAEIGVGSGAVVVALAKELPQMAWVGVDSSRPALEVASLNARRHEVAGRVCFVQGDLLGALKPGPHLALLVANLPYVPRAQWEVLPKDIRDYEPQEALQAGDDGLRLLKPLARRAQDFLRPGGWLLLEVGENQAALLRGILEETGAFDLAAPVRDYQGIDRVVRGRRRAA